jgi:hypothetical protein
MINEVGINDKCGVYLRLIPLVLLLVPPTLPLVPPGGTKVFPCKRGGEILVCYDFSCNLYLRVPERPPPPQ